MMKIVPASRRVTEASWEPPSSARRRATTPAGGAVADCVSITATRVHPETRREATAMPGCINHSLRLGWIGRLMRGSRAGLSSWLGQNIRLWGEAARGMPSQQATPCDETLRLGFHESDQAAEALAV